MNWDIFCKVIDNYGDIGVCWRLAADLADRGHAVRLMIDEPGPLGWMAPHGHSRVEVLCWPEHMLVDIGDVVVTAFSCDLDDRTMQLMSNCARQGRAPVWFNLEYLSAESFSERAHLCKAPVLTGPAAGLARVAFYPGFAPKTGGLMREPGLTARQAVFDRTAWLHTHGIVARGNILVSMFCYEPDALKPLLRQWIDGQHDVMLLVCAGRPNSAVKRALPELPDDDSVPLRLGRLSVVFLPWLTQDHYDHLLWSCDLNFVRGEDSLVRALWAAKPWIWQVYPQHDGAHGPKLEALMNRLAMPGNLRQFMREWNGLLPWSNMGADLLVDLPALGRAAEAARSGLMAQEDLTSQLIGKALHSG